MRSIVKLTFACLMVLALLASLTVGCGGGGGEKKVIIVAGYLTDVTGMISSVMAPHYHGTHDAIRYLNETDPIPGAKLEVATYDTHWDPSRFVPGYEWVKERGAQLLLSPTPQVSEVILSFQARDKLPNFTPTGTQVMMQSEWTNCTGMPVRQQSWGALKWISDNWPNYPTKPKIGACGWETPHELDEVANVKAYIAAHPDKFEYVREYLTTPGQMTWSAEVEGLKGCDWIGMFHGAGTGQATFIKEFRQKGYTATKFFSGEEMYCWTNLIIGSVGWDTMNGSICHGAWPWWTDDYGIVNLAEQLMTQYHPGEVDTLKGNIGYIAAFLQGYFIYQLVKATAAELGPENVDGQAIQDKAINFSYQLEGIPPWSFSGDYVAAKYGAVYMWSASTRDLVRATEWAIPPQG